MYIVYQCPEPPERGCWISVSSVEKISAEPHAVELLLKSIVRYIASAFEMEEALAKGLITTHSVLGTVSTGGRTDIHLWLHKSNVDKRSSLKRNYYSCRWAVYKRETKGFHRVAHGLTNDIGLWWPHTKELAEFNGCIPFSDPGEYRVKLVFAAEDEIPWTSGPIWVF